MQLVKSVTVFSVLSIGLAHAQPIITNAESVAKSFQVAQATAVTTVKSQELNKRLGTLTTYTNSTFNFQYIAPSGWSFNTPSVYSDGVLITATNPSYSAFVGVDVYNRGFSTDAIDFARSKCFYMTGLAWKSSVPVGSTSSTAPLVYTLVDTFYTSSNFGQAWTQVKYYTNWTSVAVEYAYYTSNFVIEVWYFTTSADIAVNSNNYFQNVLGATFINLNTVMAKKSAAMNNSDAPLFKINSNTADISSSIQGSINLTMYDLLGRKVACLYKGSSDGAIPLGSNASNAYILQLKANREGYTARANTFR